SLNYQVDNGPVQTQNVTGLSTTTNQTYAFTHNINWTPSTTGNFTIKVWAASPNGQTDADNTNDTLSKVVSIFDTIVAKTVVIEQATGAWCQYCPDGSVVLAGILANNPGKTIGVAIHNGDGMAFTDGNAVNSAYAQGYPNGYVDRVLFPDQAAVGMSRSVWAAKTAERLNDIVPVLVTGTATYGAGKVITIEMSAKFYSGASGDFRVNAYIVEDSVTGTGSAYNQANYYNTVAGHPYYGAGNPIIGYKHRHVLRAMLGGPWGTSGVIPATVNKNDIFNKQYTYTVPSGINPNRLKVVFLVQKYNSDPNQRPILNAAEYHLGFVDAIEEQQLNGDFAALYPNPAENVTNIEFMLVKSCNVRMEVLNLLGERVSSAELGTMPVGEHQHQVDVTSLPAGVYILRADFGGTSRTIKFTVK
ncbi:MAG TPA: Omp28-related outer membrane protein, partial [Bacteroidales bacterium]|nr:Omp28-related outer membrane protein [Bacteroidales bacterium]